MDVDSVVSLKYWVCCLLGKEKAAGPCESCSDQSLSTAGDAVCGPGVAQLAL